MIIDFSNQKFRCSSLGALMTNKQGKTDTRSIEELSATAKGELIKIYVKAAYGREKEIKSKFLEKGLAVEEDAITLLSRVKRKLFVKNTEQFENDFITGEPDITTDLIDTKSCWDIHTFFEAKTSTLDKGYEWQIRGYGDLLKKSYGTVAFCLLDTPLGLIEEEKKRVFYRNGSWATMENPEYLAECARIEKEMTFEDIPMKERVHEVAVKCDPELMQKVYTVRVPIWREWLNVFAKSEAEKYVQNS